MRDITLGGRPLGPGKIGAALGNTGIDMSTPIQTPFGFKSTVDDVIAGVDLSGKRAVVTGGGSGIGIDTARALASAGAHVTLAVRTPDAARLVALEIARSARNPQVDVDHIDLSDLLSVQEFVRRWRGPLHILVNNAGVMAVPTRERTSQGLELQFGTNFFGHFALTIGLHSALAEANGARVVSVSSSGHLFAPVFFDDPGFDFIPYDPFLAYGQSKTACALLAVEVTRRWSGDGIFANSLNPGAIPTQLQRHTGGLRSPLEKQKTAAQGAATSVLLATSSLLDGVGGRYFEDCNEAAVVDRRPDDYSGVAAYAVDSGNAERLWVLASALAGSKHAGARA